MTTVPVSSLFWLIDDERVGVKFSHFSFTQRLRTRRSICLRRFMGAGFFSTKIPYDSLKIMCLIILVDPYDTVICFDRVSVAKALQVEQFTSKEKRKVYANIFCYFMIWLFKCDLVLIDPFCIGKYSLPKVYRS